MYRVLLSFLFLSFILFSSCASVPTMELESARKAIMESEKVNAAKYASEELEKSKQLLSTATNQVTLKKNKLAKESAIQSKAHGDKAYIRSLEEFVKDQNETTQKSFDTAKGANADAAVPDTYGEAMALYDEVQKEMNRLKIETAKLQQLQAASTPATNK